MNTALEIHAPDERRDVSIETASPANMTPMQMAYQLISNGADLGSVKEMLAMSKELAADQAKRAFDEAVAEAKAEIPTVTKNAKGHNSKAYADFAAYSAVVDPVIGRFGLSYRFRTVQTDRITVTCVLTHKGGHAEENSLSGPADSSGSKNAIQAIGSTLTYLQRYTLIQALGLSATGDDDGQSSNKTEEQVRTISHDQLKKLRAKLEETNSDVAAFCKLGKIDALPDMRASDFDAAMGMLEQKRARLNKQVPA